MRKSIKMLALSTALTLTSLSATAANTVTEINEDLIPAVQARDVGVKVCLKPINDVVQYLVKDRQHGAHGNWNTDLDNMDDTYYSASIENIYADGSTYADVTAAPLPNGQCFITYSTVSLFDENCTKTAQDIPGLKFKDSIARSLNWYKNGDVNLFLQDVGKNGSAGCRVVKKEVLLFNEPT